MGKKDKIFKVITIVMVVITLFSAGYIMVKRLGVVDGYDFGAGAYYYADIPVEEYEKVVPDGDLAGSVPKWVYYVLFLAWGWLMWRLWVWVEGRK